MMLGMIRAGRWCVRDNETKIGMRIGYNRGAGSKLEGIEKKGRFLGQRRHLRPLAARIVKG